MKDDALPVQLRDQVTHRIDRVLDTFIRVSELVKRRLKFLAETQGVRRFSDSEDTLLFTDVLEPDQPVITLQRHHRLGGGADKRLRNLLNYDFVW